jgi:nitrate reductase NapE component
MSLKTFHLIFIVASILLAFGFGAWLLRNHFSPEGRPAELVFGILSLVAGFGLIVYEIYFLRKTKGLSYI